MMLRRNLVTGLLVTFGSMHSATLAAFADIETTRVETTTITREGQPIILPTTTTYVLVDPLTGTVKGNLETARETVDIQTVAPGTVVIDQNTGKIVATINPSGRIINVLTAPALDPLNSLIDTRRGEINRKITISLNDGSITAKQAETLRTELDKVGTREANDTQHQTPLTYAEAIFLASQLNNIGERLSFLTHGSPMEPLIGSRFIYVDGQVVMAMDDLDYRRMKLAQRIDDEYVAGRLLHPQVTDLKDQLNSVATFEADNKKNGELSAEQTHTVVARLDSIESNLNQEVASK